MNGHGGKVQLQLLPISPVIEGNVDAVLRSREEQTGLLGVLADCPDEGAVRDAVDQLRPRGPEIGGLEDIRPVVVVLVAVDSDVGGAGIARGRFNEADAAPLGQFLGRDVGPVLAAVTGELN